MLMMKLRAFKSLIAKYKFAKNAVLGDNNTFMSSAKAHVDSKRNCIRIGNNNTIGALFQALCGGNISVGNNTYIGSQTVLQAKESISIGSYVIIANNVLIVDNNNHPVEPEMRMNMSKCDNFLTDELWSWKYAKSKPVVIGDNVWIGRDSRILKGVIIGEGAIVALGAIVTNDVPPYSVVAGNPAKVVKHLTNH